MDYKDYELEEDAPRFIFSSRFGMAVLGFLGFFTMSSQKMSLPIAIVCMVNETAAAILDGEPLPVPDDVFVSMGNLSTSVTPTLMEEDECGVAAEVFKSYVKVDWIEDVSEKGTLAWDKTQRNVIFRTYYLGYLFSQIPAGLLAQKFGGKRVLGFFLLAASAATLLIPFGIRYHYFLLVFLRFVGGVGAGASFPAMHCLLGRWAPPLERSKLASISYAGALTGVLVTYPITSSLCKFGYDDGWPLVFYVVGGAGFLWFGLWISTASESPLEHKRISKEERDYIVAVLAKQANLEPTPYFFLPFGSVVSSLPFLAIVIANFAFDWGLYVFETVIPVYLYKMLEMDLRQVTLFSMMPYVSLWICVIMSGIWSDQLRARGVIGTTVTRKIFHFIGCIVPAAMTVGLGFLDCTQWRGAVAMVILGFSFLGFQYNGFLVNHIDIAPRYSAVLMGISNTFGTSTYFLAPLMIDVIAGEGTKEQWQTVFLSTGCVYLFGMCMFLVCGSGTLQSWAKDDPLRSRGYGTTIVVDGKRPSKLYMDLASPDGDVGKGRTVKIDGTLQYQALGQNTLPNAKQSIPGAQRQGSVLRPRPGLAGGRPEIPAYATLPRSRAEVMLNSPTSGTAPVRMSRRLPDIEGYPTLRKNADLSNYQTPFRKPATTDDSARQLLIPPSSASGSGLSRKSSKNSSRHSSSRNSRNSADMSNKRSSHISADASAYNDLNESIV